MASVAFVSSTPFRRLSLAAIDAVVSARLGPTRVQGNAQPACFNRQVAMYLAKHVAGWSTTCIGRFYNGRDHSTVIHGIQRIQALRESDAEVDALLSELNDRLVVSQDEGDEKIGEEPRRYQEVHRCFGENDHPWNRWSPPIYIEYGYLDYRRRLGVKPQKYSREIVFLQQDRKTPGNSAGGWIVQENGKPFPIEAQYSFYLTQRACNELDDLTSSPETNRHPIYYQLDLFDPHQPLSIPAGFEKRENELRKSMTVPETYEQVRAHNWKRFEDQPDIYDIYRKYWGLYDASSLREYRIAYALQMELVDQVIGVFIQKLKTLGLYQNSMIIFNSDHGEMNGRWALIDKGVYLYPDVLRVPLVIKPPAAMQINPHTAQEPVSLMHIGPTVLSLVGIRPEAKFDGQSLLPQLERTSPSRDRELLFFGGRHVGVNFPCGIQEWNANGSHYLYSYNCSSPVEELYDLNAVDAENLARKPEHAALRKRMIERLGSVLQHDPRWTGYWSEFRIAQYFDLLKTRGDMQLFGVPS